VRGVSFQGTKRGKEHPEKTHRTAGFFAPMGKGGGSKKKQKCAEDDRLKGSWGSEPACWGKNYSSGNSRERSDRGRRQGKEVERWGGGSGVFWCGITEKTQCFGKMSVKRGTYIIEDKKMGGP